MKTLLLTIGLIAAIFVLAVLSDQFTLLKELTVYLTAHPEPYRSIAIGMTILGFALLIGVFVASLWVRGRPMSEYQARAYMSTGAGRPRIARKAQGEAVGREYRSVASFRDIKHAVRSGRWSHDRSLWLTLFGLIGSLLAVYGLFGFFAIVGQPLVKLICVGALAYATVRSAWGFWKA